MDPTKRGGKIVSQSICLSVSTEADQKEKLTKEAFGVYIQFFA